jgi:NAD(P)-dependent dehydrogenase (short-subunit alcohol dehydrogenase family)
VTATFAGKTALVTGAARGIGRATAEQFGRAGGAVALVDRDRGEVERAAAHLVEEGIRALACAVDVADRASMDDAVARCERELGGLDVLVSNAGMHFARAIDEYSDEEIDRLITVNLKGTLNAIRASVRLLRRSRGSIVTVSSMTAMVGQDRGSVYAATKGAQISLTKALALELGADGIRVNCVCPAGVDTALMRGWANTLPDPEAVLRGQAAMHLMNRMAEPDEIASAILFLASPAAAFVTGIVLPVEGGATLGYRRSSPSAD